MIRALPAAVARWLHLEQQVNERIQNEAVYTSIGAQSDGIDPPYRPETSGAWLQELVLVDEDVARGYGPVRPLLQEALGLSIPAGRIPIFVHPQSRKLFAAAIAEHRLQTSDVKVRATASGRSLLAQSGARPPCVLKLGIDTFIAERWRGFEEQQVARAIVVSGLLDQIEPELRDPLRFEWFQEVCGAATDVPGKSQGQWNGRRTSGWLLRRLPPCLSTRGTTLVPLFSLISRHRGEPSMLTRMIRAARAEPARFVIDHLIRPLVQVYAHLALVEGLVGEMHSQNVLYEIDSDERLTGRLVIRDFTDMSVNVALRLARRRPMRALPDLMLPPHRPFPLAWITTDQFLLEWGRREHRADLCVAGHGMNGSVWVIHRGLRRDFAEVHLATLKSAYLRMWRLAVRHYLGVDPLTHRGLTGLPIDASIEAFLSRTRWPELGAKPSALPPRRELRWIGAGPQRRAPARALALESAWGEIFITDNGPSFFRPAF